MSSIEKKNNFRDRYEKIAFIGEGQFATVYKVRDRSTNKIVAMKKIKVGDRIEAEDGVNRTALREIKILRECNHENVLILIDVHGSASGISLVFDFMSTDLEILIKNNSIYISPSDIKAFTIMTLLGMEYLHNKWILHRDLKPNNLLIDAKGVLKIADFGLAKKFGSPNMQYTSQVVTRWYRAPELLFGAKMYGTNVDIWAIGCILAELLLRVPFLPGNSDLDQLKKIFHVMGNPTEEKWPGVTSLPDYIDFNETQAIPFSEIFTACSQDVLDVLVSMLNLNPLKRPTCSEALQMPYFNNDPAPTPCEKLPIPDKGSDLAEAEVENRAQKRVLSGDKMATIKRLNFD